MIPGDMIPDDHRYRYRYRYRSYTDTYTDTYTETNTDTDMLRRTSNRQPVCKLRYARARGNQSATSNAYKQLLGCFAGIINCFFELFFRTPHQHTDSHPFPGPLSENIMDPFPGTLSGNPFMDPFPGTNTKNLIAQIWNTQI